MKGLAPIEGTDDSNERSTGGSATTNGPGLRALRTEQPSSGQAGSPTAGDVDIELLERRKYLVGVRERALNERIAELNRREVNLDEREAALRLREAENEIAKAFQREALAVREKELNQLAARLERQEVQVADYGVRAQRPLAEAATPELKAQRGLTY